MIRQRRKVQTLFADVALLTILVVGLMLTLGEHTLAVPLGLIGTLPLAFYLAGLYDEAPGGERASPALQIVVACCLVGVTIGSLALLVGPLGVSPHFLTAFLVLVALLLVPWRASMERLGEHLGGSTVPVVVLGGGREDDRLLDLVRTHAAFDLRAVVPRGLDTAGGRQAIAALTNGGGTSGKGEEGHALTTGATLVVSDPRDLSPSELGILLELRSAGVQIATLPEFWEGATGRLPVHHLTDEWVAIHSGILPVDGGPMARVKRLMDLIGALSLLMILGAPTLLAALVLWLSDPGPVIYRQRRVGKNGKPFDVLKLRTMRRDAEQTGPAWTEEGDRRITRIGRIVRRTRLDEVPQLLNVLEGEMSLVGPRPEAESLSRRYTEEIPRYGLRYLVKPGVTGWAQVNLGNTCSVDGAANKLEYDLYYIRRMNPVLDLRILMKSVHVVMFGRGR